MMESEVLVTTKHGRMPRFAACPDGPGQYPGIIFYMDAPGTREKLRDDAMSAAMLAWFNTNDRVKPGRWAASAIA